MGLLAAADPFTKPAELAAICGACLATLGGFWACIRWAVRVHANEQALTRAELYPNHGSSFRDHVDRQFAELRADIGLGFEQAEERSIEQQRQINDHGGRITALEIRFQEA